MLLMLIFLSFIHSVIYSFICLLAHSLCNQVRAPSKCCTVLGMQSEYDAVPALGDLTVLHTDM